MSTAELIESLRKERLDPEDRKHRLQQLVNAPGVRLNQIYWMFMHREREFRKVGRWLVKNRFSDRRSLNQLLDYFRKQNMLSADGWLTKVLHKYPAEVLIPQLNLLIDEGQSESQRLAAHVALTMPFAEVREIVLKLLEDPRLPVRLYILQGLGQQKIDMPKEVLTVIREWLKSPDTRIGDVLNGLLSTGFTNRMYVVARLHLDSDDRVRGATGPLLQRMLADPDLNLEQEFTPLLSSSDAAIRDLAVQLLAEATERQRVVEGLIRASRNVLGWIRDRAFESLVSLGHDVLEPIYRLMTDQDPEIRLAALAAFAKLEERPLTQNVIDRLRDDDRRIKILAIEVIGGSDDERVVELLIELLNDPDLLTSVIGALGRRKDKRVVRHVIQHLNDPDPGVRMEVINALAGFDSIKTRVVFEKIIKVDADTGVRQRAREVLERLLKKHNVDHDYVEMMERSSLRLRTISSAEAGRMELLLLDTRKMGASDLHVRVGAQPLARRYGALMALEHPELTAEDCEAMLYSLLTPAQTDRLETDHQVDFCYTIEGVGRYRSNIFRERKGYAGSFRVIPMELPSVEEIGLPQQLQDILNVHQGLVVVSGSAGSGKTTTLAALVNLINENRAYHVLTLEDPIEFLHPFKKSLVNQREVHTHTRAFSRALRAALREDPDVIVVGELRDRETISLAVTAAETGHVVVGTIHATSAAKTVDRLVDAYPPSEQPLIRTLLAESLKSVVNQRLLPTRDGMGRIACFEVLMTTPAISSHIRDGRTFMIPSTMQISQQHGVVTLDRALQRLVDAQKIAPEEAWLRAENKANFAGACSKEFLEGVSADK